MNVFWALFILIHWFDVRGAELDIGVLINAVPFLVFLSVGLITTNRRYPTKADSTEKRLEG
jgi:hypothetical protein